MMSFSYRAKLSKKLNKCTYRPIWSEFCADPYIQRFLDFFVGVTTINQSQNTLVLLRICLFALVFGAVGTWVG